MDYNYLKMIENRVRALEERVLISSSKMAGIVPLNSEEDIPPLEEAKDHHVTYEEYMRHSALNVLRRHVKDFWNNISIPGFRNVGEPGRQSSDRYIWFLVLIISLFVSYKYILDVYKEWQGSLFLLSINDSLTPITLIPFPAITVCPGRRIQNEAVLQEIFNSTEGEGEVPESDLWTAAGILCPESNYFYEKYSGNISRYHNNSLHAAVDDVSINCEDVIEWLKFNDFYAEVNGENHVCSQYFQKLYGDTSNVCFSFNMLPAHEIFYEQVVPPIIDRTYFPMKPNWTPDTMLKKADFEPTIPRYTVSNGRWAGLYIGLDNFSANESGICGHVKSNTKMFFHHPAELPMSQIHESIEIPRHKELFARINPVLVTTSYELNEYSPINRKCYFSNERPLSLFKVYTQRNCQLECRVNCSLSLCDCVPLSLPRQNSSVKICGKEYRTSCSSLLITGVLENRLTWFDIVYQFRDDMGIRYQKIFEGYQTLDNEDGMPLTSEVLEANFPDCKCDCPATCTSLEYDVRVEQGAPLHPLISEHFTRVAISFKEMEVTSVVRKQLVGLIELIGNSGGVQGGFMGLCFFVLCDLVYYLTLRLWSTIKHSWDDEDDGPRQTKGGRKRERLRCCFCCGPTVDDFQ